MDDFIGKLFFDENIERLKAKIHAGLGPGGAGSTGGQANDGGAGPGGMDGPDDGENDIGKATGSFIGKVVGAKFGPLGSLFGSYLGGLLGGNINGGRKDDGMGMGRGMPGSAFGGVGPGGYDAGSPGGRGGGFGQGGPGADLVNSGAIPLPSGPGVMPMVGPMPGLNNKMSVGKSNKSIPKQFTPGLNRFVKGSDRLTDDYNMRAERLWDDYLDFEKEFFDEYGDIKDEYANNLLSIPKLEVTLPDTLGGATIPLAPKVHSAMFSDQAITKGNITRSKADTQLAGLGSRDALNKNIFNVGQIDLENSFLPTKTALDLYKMERAGELGIQQTQAGKPDGPSTLETWAPVVGTLLSSNDSGGTNLSSAWDFVKGFF